MLHPCTDTAGYGAFALMKSQPKALSCLGQMLESARGGPADRAREESWPTALTKTYKQQLNIRGDSR